MLVGQRVGSSYTSDLSIEGIRKTGGFRDSRSAAISTEDSACRSCRIHAELGALPGDLQLYSNDISSFGLSHQTGPELEEAALPPIRALPTPKGILRRLLGERVFANSRGFLGSYGLSSCSLSTTPVAREGESMERDYWYSPRGNYSKIESPAQIGRRAAERTVRRLGARKVPTQKVPVIFDPQTARTPVGSIFDAVEGDSSIAGVFPGGQIGRAGGIGEHHRH